MHQPETSGRFDGSFLYAETDDFHQRSRKCQPFTDYWDRATQKTPHLEMRSFAHSFLGLPLAIIMLGGYPMKLQQRL